MAEQVGGVAAGGGSTVGAMIVPGVAIAVAASAAMVAMVGLVAFSLVSAAAVGLGCMAVGTGAVIGGERWAERRPRRPVPLWCRPPSGAFHVVLVVPALTLLVAESVPTGHVLPAVGAWLALLAAAAVWVGRVVAYLAAHARRRAHGSPLWLAVAPVAGALVFGLVTADAPLHLRWAASRGEFERAVESDRLDGGRLGLYEITDVWRRGDDVYFTEAHTGTITYGGFAHLPDGPPPLSESQPEFSEYRHLDGPWYVWIAHYSS